MKRILIACASVVVLLAACGKSNDLKSVATNFFKALSDKKIDEAAKYATADSKQMLDLMKMGMEMDKSGKKDSTFDINNLEFGEPKITGETATMSIKNKKENDTMDFTFKKEGGEWKIAFDKNTVMQMGMKKAKQDNPDLNIDSTVKDAMNQVDSTIKK